MPDARVLVVDDAETLRRILREALEFAGMDVVAEAGDGDAAVRLAGETQPDVVLLDISMPVRDGLDALPDILTAAPSSRVVVLTGYGSDSLERRAISLGASAYLEKGTPLPELLDVLIRIAARRG